VETTKKLLKERGFDRAGVVEISREAGLTQGALYSQFKSKDVLTAEAVRKAFADGVVVWKELRDNAPDVLSAYLDAYLSDAHLTDVGSGCVVAACLSEVRRQDTAIGAAFTEGFSNMVALIQQALPSAAPPEEARRRALTVVSALVGSVALARAVAATDPGLAREIVAAARGELKQLARAEGGAPSASHRSVPASGRDGAKS
jgi:TetR/AcrR family transcriptional repressor of nem operon